MPDGFTIGAVARLCGVPIWQVDHWTRKGWLVAEGGGQGPGRHKRLPPIELSVASCVAGLIAKWAVVPTQHTFARARRRLRTQARGEGHGGDRERTAADPPERAPLG